MSTEGGRARTGTGESVSGSSSHSAVNTSEPNIARIYDYWLGGKDNFAADRAEGDRLLAIFPQMARRACQNRLFLAEAIHFLAGQGIRQFLDIGAGLPTAQNTHEVAQKIDPACRVIYADHDPVVVSHAQAMLTGEGVVAIQGDLAQPAAILKHPDVSPVLRLDEPVGLILALVLHFFEARQAREITSTFAEALAPGSAMVLSVGSGDEEIGGRLAREYKAGTLHNHSPETIAGFFAGFPLQPPGLVDVHDWKPGSVVEPKEHSGGRILAGVGWKPDEWAPWGALNPVRPPVSRGKTV